MTRACLGLLAGMYALQLSSFAIFSDHLDAVIVMFGILAIAGQRLAAICFAFGALLFFLAAQQLIDGRIAHDIAGDSIVVQVQVLDFPAIDRNRTVFLGRAIEDRRISGQLRLSWFDAPAALQQGEVWELEVRLRRPRGNQNPGGFDYESWLFRERVVATGYVVNGVRNHRLCRGDPGLTQRIRQQFVARVAAVLGESDTSAVVLAIVVGARHKLSAEQWDRYAATGTSHLMAISGLHIGLAALGVYWLVRLLSGSAVRMECSRNHHRVAVICGLLAAIAYASISGFAIPARRASLMLLLAGIFLLRQQRPDTAPLLCAACMVLAILDPLATMAPGFMLSFGAVATLLWLSQRRRLRLVTMQLGLLFALMPLTILQFDRVSLAALPVNLLAVPLFSFVTVPLALAGLVLDGPMQWLGDRALILAAYSIEWLELLLREVSGKSWAAFQVPALSGLAALYAWLPLVWAVFPPGWPGRSVAWLGLAAMLWHVPQPPQQNCAQISVLDVGQGLAVLVQTRRRTVLYDTGPAFRSGGSAARSVILPVLQHRAIRQIDRLIVSHADLDHAGGVATLAAELPIVSTLSGERLKGHPSQQCRAGHSWSYDGINFSLLHPPAKSAMQGNDRSCVVLIEVGDFRILLTGDIEKAAERLLLQRQSLAQVDVVTVPHHGSLSSSTRAFALALQPSIAIVSAAHGNHWGFPKADVIASWQAAGATVLNTATAGAVEMRVCANSGLESISAYRLMNRRIWHE